MSGDEDLLTRATRALSETTPPSQDELAFQRARLLNAHRAARKSSRARTLRWVLPLAAMLAAGSAFAAVPEQFERMARAVGELFTSDQTRLATPKKKAVRAPAQQEAASPRPLPPVLPEPAPVPAVVPVVPAADERQASEPTARKRRRARENVPAPEPMVVNEPARAVEPAPDVAPEAAAEPEHVPAADGDLGLYREAHRQHFRLRDFTAALRGWDAYLAAYPGGTFAVEARYNRAICLVRLGRRDDAKKALTPFAKGDVAHGYRRAEATKLLEALE